MLPENESSIGKWWNEIEKNGCSGFEILKTLKKYMDYEMDLMKRGGRVGDEGQFGKLKCANSQTDINLMELKWWKRDNRLQNQAPNKKRMEKEQEDNKIPLYYYNFYYPL